MVLPFPQVLWSREERKEEDRGCPGPGFYKAECGNQAVAPHTAAYSFPVARSDREVSSMPQPQRQHVHAHKHSHALRTTVLMTAVVDD